ncbi:acyl-CoA thioesterase [Flagellimonas zhangzhouensis]|uniref:Acyl-CoA thioester hydrolase n=1 Tax=Flagellimonas zhangzhouensis TaxID=1073328 RepID=A0A1H2V6L8_9FLAO|nr:acyl-CoA thioesterase [Allomuricauda zhangzhouensis]SDQ10617.1 acyl-CoA thioester hydrolase [Allomuricauda zhangzhouensis]SDW63574.1 acyl-CoA thioester hydrolase [Allomuricauda zhangzhouensis]
MFLKEFEIRWSDIDANRHMANSAYINFMSHTRMDYLGKAGFNQKSFARYNLGPVVFYEHVYYFKEAFPGKPVKVSLEFVGMSEDGMFFEFRHNFFDINGKNFARCEMMGAWIDLKERKLIGLPDELLGALQGMEKTDDFKTLTKADTRKFVQKPMDLNIPQT